MPRPLASIVSHSNDWHTPHAGRGGWRSVPHEAQRWMSSAWARAPSNQNALSRVMAGRGRKGLGTVPAHAVAGGPAVRRAVAQDAKPHDGHRVARRGQRGDLSREGASGTPASGTAVNSSRVETKRPGPRRVCGELRDRLDERASQEAVAERQRTPVVLRAVGAPNAGQPFFVQEGRHGPVGIGPTAGRLGSPRRLGVAQAAA